MNDNIAVAHKDYDTRGGGEVFVRRLAESLQCPVFVGRRNQTNEPDDAELDIREIPLSGIDKRMIDHGGIARTAAYAHAWQRAGKKLSAFDTVITSGNEPLWWVPEDQQTVIAYTHSTPRFMYDLYTETRDFTGIKGKFGSAMNTVMRTFYESNTHRPDYWIANSDLVARRIKRYWNIPNDQIQTIYPPVDTGSYSPADTPTEDEYLFLSRLVREKRVDEVIEAFEYLDAKLTIVGEGPDRDRLEELASGNDKISFAGFVNERQKQVLYSQSKALIYPPINEDFGMVPIEAMAAGTPVIGVEDGFTQFQINDGNNGILFERGLRELRRAVKRFESEGVAWSPERIADFADRFSVEQFRSGMQAAVADAQERTEITPPWQESETADTAPPRPEAVTDGGDTT